MMKDLKYLNPIFYNILRVFIVLGTEDLNINSNISFSHRLDGHWALLIIIHLNNLTWIRQLNLFHPPICEKLHLSNIFVFLVNQIGKPNWTTKKDIMINTIFSLNIDKVIRLNKKLIESIFHLYFLSGKYLSIFLHG